MLFRSLVLVLVGCGSGSRVEEVEDCQPLNATGCDPITACCRTLEVYDDGVLLSEEPDACWIEVGSATFDCAGFDDCDAAAEEAAALACDF